jgi:hypothetical protein
MTRNLPKGWPRDITFLNVPIYSPALTEDVKRLLHDPVSDVVIQTNPPSPCPQVTIRPITLASHPACHQSGLFASRNLPPSSLIIVYLGLVHGASDTDHSSSYDLGVDASLGIGIDAQKMGNEARFINDYRGIAERPNAEFKDVWVRLSNGTIERRIGVFVMSGKGREKGIRKGEEILVSYGKGFWKARSGQKHDEGD